MKKKVNFVRFVKKIFYFSVVIAFGFVNVTSVFAETASNDVAIAEELKNDENYYDCYTFDTFFMRQFDLAKKANTFNKSEFESLNPADLQVHGLHDDSDLEKDADLMFEKVRLFLENSKEINESNFDDYARVYLDKESGGSGKFATRTKSEFDELEKSGGYYFLFRGTNKKPYAETTRAGNVYLGGRVDKCENLRMEGTGIYTTSNFMHANFWACIPSKGDGLKGGKGEIVKFALDKDAKIIDYFYIWKVFQKMVEKNPDYEYFKKYLELKNMFQKSDLMRCYLSNFKVEVEFAKEVIGFDFYENIKTKSVADCMSELTSSICAHYIDINLEDLKNLKPEEIEVVLKKLDKEKYEQDYKNFIEQHPDLKKFVEKSFYIDKVAYLRDNAGLLARLMGYDVVYCEGGPFVDKSRTDLLTQLTDFNGVCPFSDCFNVVNYSKLIVCSDVCKEVEVAKSKQVFV